MTIIRRLSYLDALKLKKMIAFLGNDEAERFTKILMNNSCDILNRFLPLRMKFLSESYVLEEDNELHGMITVSPTKGNPYKLTISKLLFEHNYFEVGKQLVEYLVSKYGAKGAVTFIVSVDNIHDELLNLFTTGCGFRQCGSELLYKMPKNIYTSNKNDAIKFRPFKNSDTANVAGLYNNSVVNIYRPSLLKNEAEFKETLFQGFLNSYEINYVMEDSLTKKILSFFSIETFDNINYTLHLAIQEGFSIDFDRIFNFVNNELLRRKKNFNLFVKVKKYTKHYEELEQYLQDNQGYCVRTQLILVKDFHKLIKESSKSLKIVMFNESNPTAIPN